MESDVAAEVANTGKHGAQISVLVGDDDSATIKKVRENDKHDVDSTVVGYCSCKKVNGNQPLFTSSKTHRGVQ